MVKWLVRDSIVFTGGNLKSVHFFVLEYASVLMCFDAVAMVLEWHWLGI